MGRQVEISDSIELCIVELTRVDCMKLTITFQSSILPRIKGHFHFKLEKKFSQGVQKKYPYIILINVFSLCIYPKLHGKYF